MTILDTIRRAPMSRYQIFAISIVLMLIFMDGYDVAVMAYAAPVLSKEWGIGEVALGYLLSAGLFGMAAGSILLTPVADRIGRRPLTIIAVAIITIGMVASVLSPGVWWLFAARVVTGLGVGGMVANLNVLVAELSPDKRRGVAMGIYAAGFPIGATLCGFIARPLIPLLGWQSVFIAGAVITALMLLVSIRYLPESLEFLLSKRPPNALKRVNDILDRMGRPRLTELPGLEQQTVEQGVVREVFAGRMALRTIMLWLGYGVLTAGYYFANTWTPKIMATVTGDTTMGVTFGTIANFGGIVGCVAFGLLTVYVGVRRLLVGTLVVAALSFVVFAVILHQTTTAMIIAAVLGLLTTAGIVGFYTLSPQVYSARARATGTGWMIGAGRLVSIVSPIFVGYLFAAHWSPDSVFRLFAIPLLTAALCVVVLGISSRRTQDPHLAEQPST
ncbi:benzoate transport [Kibdelosporangium banguiense]|uniref:Benzoate transport n=1 Tax=Kibdelosporangium banguiense TaxID=1365924 RepID=A0ABS4TZ96_9PSEU|nr:MFS transporter [Kibdelosporangium banguiense]MBP2329231.1 benzoate transport [Kibdelosporangium banguiense]